MTLRLAWFSTGRGPGSRRLFAAVANAIQTGYIRDTTIEFVFCNRQPGEYAQTDEFFRLVKSKGVKYLALSSRYFRKTVDGEISIPHRPLPPWRYYYDDLIGHCIEEGAQLSLAYQARASKNGGLTPPLTKPLITKTEESDPEDVEHIRIGMQPPLIPPSVVQAPQASGAGHKFDIGILAGYMLITTENLCDRYQLLNLHPALPEGPSGTWQEVIWQLVRERATHGGAMMHVATRIVDQGPPASYCRFSLRGPEFDPLWRDLELRGYDEVRQEGEDSLLFQAIRRAGLLRELPLVVETIRAFGHGRRRLVEHQVIGEGRKVTRALDLTEEIERQLDSCDEVHNSSSHR